MKNISIEVKGNKRCNGVGLNINNEVICHCWFVPNLVVIVLIAGKVAMKIL